MKKILFSLFFFSVMVIGAQAQKSSCAKSCTAKPASAAASCHSNSGAASTASVNPVHCTAPSSAAAKLAASDPTIETITCPDGTVCYKRKVTDASTGQAAYVSLSYDAASNTFVNVAPSTMEGASCHGKATGTATSTAVKSSCTPASGKACCAGKAKSASATTTTTTEGQAVKTSGSIKN